MNKKECKTIFIKNKNNKRGKNIKKNSDKDYFIIGAGKSFKEDENIFMYKNLNNFLLHGSNNFSGKDVISNYKLDNKFFYSYSNKPFIIINKPNYEEQKKIFFDDIISFKLILCKNQLNGIIKKIRFGINELHNLDSK